MVNKSTNINKINNPLISLNTHKKNIKYGVENPGPGLG
jgi:hypothetical protein